MNQEIILIYEKFKQKTNVLLKQDASKISTSKGKPDSTS